ncbi:MAG: hypothetical protein RBR02_11245, partial [Desulfuromonadaceae bacterium]|nr:hypothetical protein [Desulfuromonadaceae bacterium]
NTAVNKGKADVKVLELRLSEAKQTTEKVLKSTEKLYKSVTFDNPQVPTDTRFFDYVEEERVALKDKLAAAELRAEQQAVREKEAREKLLNALESKKELIESNRMLLAEKIDLRASQTSLTAQVQELKNEITNFKDNRQKLLTALKIEPKEGESANQAIYNKVSQLREKIKSLKEKVEPLMAFFERFKNKLSEQTKLNFPTLYPKQPSLETAMEKVQDKVTQIQKTLNGSSTIDIHEAQKRANVVTIEDIRLANRGYEEHQAKQKNNDRGYER